MQNFTPGELTNVIYFSMLFMVHWKISEVYGCKCKNIQAMSYMLECPNPWLLPVTCTQQDLAVGKDIMYKYFKIINDGHVD